MVAGISINTIKSSIKQHLQPRGKQKTVSKNTGIPESNLIHWKNQTNDALPNFYDIIKLADALSVTLYELAGINTKDDALNIPDIRAVAEVLAELPPADRKNMRKIAELYPELTEQQRKMLLMMVETFNPLSEQTQDEPEPTIAIDEIREEAQTYSIEDVMEILHIPSIAAGPPIELNESIGTVMVPHHLIVGSKDEYRVVTVRGGSMVEEGIDDGDVVLLRSMKAGNIASGNIYAVRYRNESTLKKIRIDIDERGLPYYNLVWCDGTDKEVQIRDDDWAVMAEFVEVVKMRREYELI